MEFNAEEYEKQLAAVEAALKNTENVNVNTIAELETLKATLEELLNFTKPIETEHINNVDEIPIGNGIVDFVKEIEIEFLENCARENIEHNELEIFNKKLKDKFDAIIGRKCSAPHQHAWGAVSYHNAIISGSPDVLGQNEDGKFNAQLRVLFTNPTHKEMLPCSYYLNGECRFNDEMCHYSHGEIVELNDLREYSPPNFNLLKKNCPVLAKLSDGIWYRGLVLCVNDVEKLCRIRLENQKDKNRERELHFEDLFPMCNQEDDICTNNESQESDLEDNQNTEIKARTNLVRNNLFSFETTQPLGEWEKYTKGIGSKLMAKMGYVYGSGLGCDGRGIVIPVSAQILPLGRSLDYCMDLRTAANGDKDLFSVEKIMTREQKKIDALNANAYKCHTQHSDVFAFLNNNVLRNGSDINSDLKYSKRVKPILHKQCNKSLNVQSVQLSDDIRRTEREVKQLQQSIQRNVHSDKTCKHLQLQLNAKQKDLFNLQQQQKHLSNEQAARKCNEKFHLF